MHPLLPMHFVAQLQAYERVLPLVVDVISADRFALLVDFDPVLVSATPSPVSFLS